MSRAHDIAKSMADDIVVANLLWSEQMLVLEIVMAVLVSTMAKAQFSRTDMQLRFASETMDIIACRTNRLVYGIVVGGDGSTQ